jgi:hypothetical protein
MMMKAIDIAFRDVEVFDVGKLQLTAQSAHTMLVPADAPAELMARQADATDACVVLVVDGSGSVQGLVAPNWVRRQLNTHKGIRARSFADALTKFAQDPNEVIRNFEHEWLNVQRVELHWCPVGKHFTDPPRCPKHGV